MNTTRPGGRPNNLSWHPRFLAAFAKSGTIKSGCAAAGVDRHTYYDHVKKFPEFGRAVQDAADDVADDVETEAFRRAVHGIPRIVGWKDDEPIVVTKYSDKLLMLLLKGRRPEIYGNKVRVEVKRPSHHCRETEGARKADSMGCNILAKIREEATKGLGNG